MTTLREAAQQALEALKSSTPKPRNEDDDYARHLLGESEMIPDAIKQHFGVEE